MKLEWSNRKDQNGIWKLQHYIWVLMAKTTSEADLIYIIHSHKYSHTKEMWIPGQKLYPDNGWPFYSNNIKFLFAHCPFQWNRWWNMTMVYQCLNRLVCFQWVCLVDESLVLIQVGVPTCSVMWHISHMWISNVNSLMPMISWLYNAFFMEYD